MKKKLNSITIFCFFLLFSSAVFAQEIPAKDSTALIGKTWVACTDTVLTQNHPCIEPVTAIEFLAGGRYKEYPAKPIDPHKPFLSGSWVLRDDELTMDQDDEAGLKQFPKTYKIVWTNVNSFYSAENKDALAGPVIYTYFNRVPNPGN